MVQWTLEAARSSCLFDRILACSDDLNTFEIAYNNGTEARYMTPDLSGDDVPVIDVVRRCAEGFTGTVALLYACQPFMTGEVLKAACAEFERGEAWSPLLSVSRDGGDIADDAGMFCFYDSAHITRGPFRYFHVPGVIDINVPDDLARADELFKTRKET